MDHPKLTDYIGIVPPPPQVVDVCSRKKSAYVHIKMPALLMLKYMSKVGSEGGGLHGGS